MEWTSGRREFVGVVPIPTQHGAPFVVAVGVDYEQALAGAHRRGLWVLGVSTAALVAALLGTWWFAVRFIRQPLARLIEVVEGWRRGDGQARAGAIAAGTEIAQLGRAFDDMVEAVAKRKKRLRDALESTTDSVWAIDRNWHVTFITDAPVSILRAASCLGSISGRRSQTWSAVPSGTLSAKSWKSARPRKSPSTTQLSAATSKPTFFHRRTVGSSPSPGT
jgi:methyl-accepting chemotaxis protein